MNVAQRLLAPVKELFKQRVQQAGVVVGLGYAAPEYPPISFSDYKEDYKRDPTVQSAADFLEQAVAGMGGYTTADDHEAKRAVDEFNELIKLDALHMEVAKWALMCGNYFLERIYSEYEFENVLDPLAGSKADLKVPSPKAELVGVHSIPFTSIQRDRYGKVLWYNQQKGEAVKLSPKLVIHYAWNVVDREPCGTGWLTSLLMPGKSPWFLE